MMNKIILSSLFLLFTSCYRVSNQIQPTLNYYAEETHFQNLSSAFPDLTQDEQKQDWGKEYLIARSFAKQMDLYRAISTFKRAEILIGERYPFRKQEIEYDILLCYYLGKKYEELLSFFENSSLARVDKTFPTFHDLLIILYESYQNVKNEEKVDRIENLLHQNYPHTSKNLHLSQYLQNANFSKIEKLAKGETKENISPLLSNYDQNKKSVSSAQIFNAILPGSGYLYLGQKRSALTSFLMNSLFIASSYQFFKKGYVAAGVVTAGFEMGWYFGGIYGAGLEAKFYNERLYENTINPFMNEKKQFPIFMIEYSF